jgi:hypothetical protein
VLSVTVGMLPARRAGRLAEGVCDRRTNYGTMVL